jgi:hypothetical protein
VLQILDVRTDVIVLTHRLLAAGVLEGQALDVAIPGRQQLVSARGDKGRHRSVGRSAVRGVVLEAAVIWRVVRGRDDNAVGWV